MSCIGIKDVRSLREGDTLNQNLILHLFNIDFFYFSSGSNTTQEKPSPAKKGRYHEVRSGDTLFGIAGKYDITINELCRLNNKSSRDIIYPGQRLLVLSESRR